MFDSIKAFPPQNIKLSANQDSFILSSKLQSASFQVLEDTFQSLKNEMRKMALAKAKKCNFRFFG